MQRPIVLVLVSSSSASEATASVAGKAAAAVSVLHAQDIPLVFAGWQSVIPRHWRQKQIPFIELKGNLRSSLPFTHILVFGEATQALDRVLADYLQRFQAQVIDQCETLVFNEILLQLQHIPALNLNATNGQVNKTESTTVNSGPRDVVVFWKQNDTGLYGRRSDMLVRYLATRDDVRRVLVFDAPIQLQRFLAEPGDNWFNQTRHVYVRTLQRMLDTKPDPAFSEADNKLNLRTGVYDKQFGGFQFYQQFIADELADLEIDPSQALFILYPRVRGGERIIEHFKPWRVVTDVVDDHRAWPDLTDQRKAMLTAHYREILGASEYVITNCLPVKISMLEFHDRIKVIPNGCDSAPPVAASWLNADILAELREYEGPVLAYVGNLESKIDVPLLERVAATYSDALVLLIGSTHANTDVLALQNLPNVRFTGVLPYAEANAVLEFVDVGLVPHLTTDLTVNMNPLKAYMYLSHHIPVVATAVPNLVAHEYIRRTTSHDDFVSAIGETLGNKANYEHAVFQRFVSDNSWALRFEAWFDVVLNKHD